MFWSIVSAVTFSRILLKVCVLGEHEGGTGVKLGSRFL